MELFRSNIMISKTVGRIIKHIRKPILTFDPRKTFFQLRIVWLTIIGILGFTMYSGILIEPGLSTTLCRTGECYADFIEQYQFQIGLLAILVPILAVYAAQHRSAISVEQIRQSEIQNRFTNFYKHREEFDKYIRAHKETAWLNNTTIIHSKIFPLANEGNYRVQQEFIDNCVKYVQILKLGLEDWFQYDLADDIDKTDKLASCNYLNRDLTPINTDAENELGFGFFSFIYHKGALTRIKNYQIPHYARVNALCNDKEKRLGILNTLVELEKFIILITDFDEQCRLSELDGVSDIRSLIEENHNYIKGV